MCWKKMSYWLKGGIKGVLALIISYIIFFISSIISWYSMTLLCGSEDKKGLIGTCDFLANYQWYLLFWASLLIIIFFIIGAVIGFIVGKIKKRKNSKK